MPITISDVAKEAGVSIKTVSRVVNNEHNVSEKTRQKVLSAVEALGYTPNPSAQSLARGYTGEIGLLVYNVADTYMMEVLHGLLDVAEKIGYRVTVSRCDIHQPDDITRIIRMASQRIVQGFIFTPPCDNSMEIIEALQKINFPFVKLSPRERSQTSSWVGTSDEQGCFEATTHLLDLGHRVIGFVQGDADHLGSWHRLEGFRRALHTYSIEPDTDLILQGDWRFESGVRCAETLFSREQRPTAVVAANDEVAAGIIQTAWRYGIHCPDQLSVVGFDDVPLARQLCPPLTTVSQPIYELATTAMSILQDILRGNETVRNIEVPARLVIRQSTMRLVHP